MIPGYWRVQLKKKKKKLKKKIKKKKKKKKNFFKKFKKKKKCQSSPTCVPQQTEASLMRTGFSTACPFLSFYK